ncbi:4-alpha-glucanotransferase [Chitinibacter sp. ZOR0017]|uniref:4-alpha-glucanotransferase n=1 Tax=Chitinibacter sp. ZOR0017 TaxID=1339254 RepID=UPI000645C55F|nr:4-alpha-glucanotransferase [Chitinibacter sp. ZOR0017]
MSLTRAAGILVHLTSLPSPYGIGDLGPGAYRLVDFLASAGQRVWQVLPLGPTSYGDSPYQSFSTFAGNPLLISPELLIADGLLSAEQIPPHEFDPRRVDYGRLLPWKTAVLRAAWQGLQALAPTHPLTLELSEFCAREAAWLDDYALFIACKQHFIAARQNEYESAEYQAYYQRLADKQTVNQIKDCYYGAVWNSWPTALAQREAKALKQYRQTLAAEIAFAQFCQFIFARQWQALKSYANQQQIQLLGDLPIFVSQDSADVWANRSLFQLDAAGDPLAVAGVPPDYFSATGQLWGNPLYAWPAHKKTKYRWWVARVAAALARTDLVRIDHFRAFAAHWSVPFGEPTAEHGQWCASPGAELFAAIRAELGDKLGIVAEDLGVITPDVTALRESLGLPGMKVLQFAFDGSASSDHLPHNYPDAHTVVYTGTHDNDTTLGWYASSPEISRDHLRRYLNVSGEAPHWDLIRLAWSTPATLAIAPIQDLFGAPGSERMNTPGVASGNWQYRFLADELTPELAARLRYLGELFGRAPS